MRCWCCYCVHKAMMGALAEDQRAIENVLEGERIRAAENLRIATAARKAREDRHAEEEGAAEKRCGHLNIRHEINFVQHLNIRHEVKLARRGVIHTAQNDVFCLPTTNWMGVDAF